ncbi:MAG: hypothetical protein AVDCRST_MAG85-3226, partial [uncultured Solirubrobacteraceae bacterium]
EPPRARSRRRLGGHTRHARRVEPRAVPDPRLLGRRQRRGRRAAARGRRRRRLHPAGGPDGRRPAGSDVAGDDGGRLGDLRAQPPRARAPRDGLRGRVHREVVAPARGRVLPRVVALAARQGGPRRDRLRGLRDAVLARDPVLRARRSPLDAGRAVRGLARALLARADAARDPRARSVVPAARRVAHRRTREGVGSAARGDDRDDADRAAGGAGRGGRRGLRDPVDPAGASLRI